MENFYTISDVAKMLQISAATIRRAIRAGLFRVHRVGKQGQIRISREQLNDYLRTTESSDRRVYPDASAERTLHLTTSEAARPYPESNRQGTIVTCSGETDIGLQWQVIQSDASKGMRNIPSESINCIVTSPPYYWQRDYEVEGQIGHESTIQEFVDSLRSVFREAMRVLTEDGVLFLNLGDTYYSAKGKPHGRDQKHNRRQLSRRMLRAVDGPGLGIPRKSLIGLPWRVALALQDDGWVLRSSIIWKRPAPMPEPTAKDRPWRTHEPVFLFSRSPRYWFNRSALGVEEDIWEISAHSRNPGANFAPYPLEFAERCVTLGCPIGGTVLDPFVGSGTTMFAALKNGMSAIGIDLKPEFTEYICTKLRTQYDAKTIGTVSDNQQQEQVLA